MKKIIFFTSLNFCKWNQKRVQIDTHRNIYSPSYISAFFLVTSVLFHYKNSSHMPRSIGFGHKHIGYKYIIMHLLLYTEASNYIGT